VIDWIDTACKAWGRCTRWIIAQTVEGYPCMDTIERAGEGLLSMRECGGLPHAQHFSEVRRGDALLVENAMKQAPLMSLPSQGVIGRNHV
jgi:hypothetical protein